MKQDNNISVLLDFYGAMLTEKQRLALEMYYNMDFSLAEIAENIGVTRQCAHDFIKKGEAHLCEYEEKTGLCRRFADVLVQTENIRRCVHCLSDMKSEQLQKTENRIMKSLDIIAESLNGE